MWKPATFCRFAQDVFGLFGNDMQGRKREREKGEGSEGGTVPALSFEPLNILGKANMRQLPPLDIKCHNVYMRLCDM